MASNNVLLLMTRVLGETFAGATWATWRAVLAAAFALDLTDEERQAVTQLTQRQTLPPSPVRELWLLLGRRSGKSIIAALLAVWATCCRTYTLAPGEVGVFMVIAADRKQARVIKRYIAGLLRSHPSLDVLLEKETADAIWLTSGLCIEIHTCSFRSLRGYTCVGAACDEIAFWDDEDSANPDHEVLVALRAAMASVPEAMLIGLTSVYARRGEVWRMFEKHFGKDSADVLIVNGATTTMNPTISQTVIDTAYEDDPIAAAAEYGAEFRRDVEVFLPAEALDAVRMPGRFEQPFHAGVTSHAAHAYVAFLDPAGGTGQDSMTLAIAHHEHGRARPRARGEAALLTRGHRRRVRRRAEGVRAHEGDLRPLRRELADRGVPQGGHHGRAEHAHEVGDLSGRAAAHHVWHLRAARPRAPAEAVRRARTPHGTRRQGQHRPRPPPA
jgi:hypothetical protein